MRVESIFHGTIERGKIKLDRQSDFAALLYRLEGKEISVTLKRRRRARSLSQNAYFHGVVLPILAEAAGYELDEMKDALKWTFLRVEPSEKGKLPRVRGTSDLDTAEMTEFIEQCKRLGAQMYGCYVPEPGQIEVGAGW